MPDNHFEGDAAGPVVQAGTVHGGVHLSITPAPLVSASVALATRAAARIAMGPPQQLPSPGELLDRRTERQALDRVAEQPASPDRNIVVLHGPPGIGKTTLASWWLRSVQHHFPDGQLYADLRAEAGPAGSAAGVRARWLRALGVPADLVPDDPYEQAALWRTVTSGRRLAVLLDDINRAEQVLHLAPVTGLVVATCRRVPPELIAHRAWTLLLDPLAEDDAVALIQQVRERDLNRAADDTTNTHGPGDLAESRELARRCGFVPLALCAAAAAPLPAAAITTPTTAAADAAASEILEAVIASASQHLPPATARAYALLGAAPLDHLSVITAAAALGIDDTVAQTHLTALRTAHLLTSDDCGRYRFPATVRAHTEPTRQRLPQADHDAVFTRLAGHYLDHAIAASRAARPHAPAAADDTAQDSGDIDATAARNALREGLLWLDREQDNLAALIHAAHRRGEHTTVLQLVDALWPACRLRLIPNPLWKALDTLALDAADRGRDRDTRARVRDRLTVCLLRGGDFVGAARRLAEAEQLWRDPPEPRKLAGSARRWGHLAKARGELIEAIACFERALQAYGQLSDAQDPQRDRHLALTHLDLAGAYLDTGAPTAALPYLEQAYEYFRHGHYPVDLGRTHRYLGQAHTRTGDLTAAARHLQTALILALGLGEAELQRVIQARDELARAHPGARPC